TPPLPTALRSGWRSRIALATLMLHRITPSPPRRGHAMKITDAKCRLVRLPADEPLANGPQVSGAVREIVTLELGTDQGIEGVGITFFGAAISRSLLAAVEDLAALAKGED